MANRVHTPGEGAVEQMIYRYPEAQYKQYLTTGTCLVAFGAIMLILFSIKIFIRQPVIHYLLFITGFLSIFPTGLTQFIRGFKHREIGYELDYSGFNIVHPEGIKTNVRWDDIKGIDESPTSIKFMTPRGQEEIYKNLEKFEEFYEVFKKYTKRELKKTAEGPRATPVSPKPSLKEQKVAENLSPPQKEGKSPAEKEGTPAKKGDEARDRMLKEIFAAPSTAERAAEKESRPQNGKPADSTRETGKTAAAPREPVKTEIASPAGFKWEEPKGESGAKAFEAVFGEVESPVQEGDLPAPDLRGADVPSLNKTAAASETGKIQPPQGGFDPVFEDFLPSMPVEKEEKSSFATAQLSIKPDPVERGSTGAPPVSPLDTIKKEKAAFSITPPSAAIPEKEERLSLGDLLGAPERYRDAFPESENPRISLNSKLPEVIPLLPERSPSPKAIPLPTKEQASRRSDGARSSIPTPHDLMSSLKLIKDGLVPFPEAGAFIPPPSPPYSRKSAPKEEHQETSFTLSLSAAHSHRQNEPKHPASEVITHVPGMNTKAQTINPAARREDEPLKTRQIGRREETPYPAKKPAEREDDRRTPANAPATKEIAPADREKVRTQSGSKATPAGNAEPATVETMMNDFVLRLRLLSR